MPPTIQRYGNCAPEACMRFKILLFLVTLPDQRLICEFARPAPDITLNIASASVGLDESFRNDAG